MEAIKIHWRVMGREKQYNPKYLVKLWIMSLENFIRITGVST